MMNSTSRWIGKRLLHSLAPTTSTIAQSVFAKHGRSRNVWFLFGGAAAATVLATSQFLVQGEEIRARFHAGDDTAPMIQERRKLLQETIHETIHQILSFGRVSLPHYIRQSQPQCRIIRLSKEVLSSEKELLQVVHAILYKGARVDVESLVHLCHAATDVFRTEDTLLDKTTNIDMVSVVGDLHGCLSSLKSTLEMTGLLHDSDSATTTTPTSTPSNRCVVFAGDFVDRGEASLEVWTVLLLLKVAFPQQVVLLRGNHEDSKVAEVYGFAEEVQTKYQLSSHEHSDHNRSMPHVWKTLSDTFAALPIAVVTDTAFIVHGGLPSRHFKLDQLRQVTIQDRCRYNTLVRPTTSVDTLMERLLWSDPMPQPGIRRNRWRGGRGMEFGPDVTHDFLTREGLHYLVRAHEPVDAGFETVHCSNPHPTNDAVDSDETTTTTRLVTVFSSANYPNGTGTNHGAILQLYRDGTHKAIQFSYQT